MKWIIFVYLISETSLNADIKTTYNEPTLTSFSVLLESDETGGVTFYCERVLDVDPVDSSCPISNHIKEVLVKFWVSY